MGMKEQTNAGGEAVGNISPRLPEISRIDIQSSKLIVDIKCQFRAIIEQSKSGKCQQPECWNKQSAATSGPLS
jgi:hypothetical protein